jgi:hypothetical protein
MWCLCNDLVPPQRYAARVLQWPVVPWGARGPGTQKALLVKVACFGTLGDPLSILHVATPAAAGTVTC